MIAHPETLLLLAGAALAIFIIHRYIVSRSVRPLTRFDDNPHGADHVADIDAGGSNSDGDGK